MTPRIRGGGRAYTKSKDSVRVVAALPSPTRDYANPTRRREPRDRHGSDRVALHRLGHHLAGHQVEPRDDAGADRCVLAFGLAYVVLFLIGNRLARREGGARPSWDLILVNGIGQFVINYAIVYWAEQTLPSGLVAVLWAVFPLMVAGLGHFMLRGERISGRQCSASASRSSGSRSCSRTTCARSVRMP